MSLSSEYNNYVLNLALLKNSHHSYTRRLLNRMVVSHLRHSLALEEQKVEADGADNSLFAAIVTECVHVPYMGFSLIIRESQYPTTTLSYDRVIPRYYLLSKNGFMTIDAVFLLTCLIIITTHRLLCYDQINLPVPLCVC